MAKKSTGGQGDHGASRMHHAYAVTGKVPGVTVRKAPYASGGSVKEEDFGLQKYGSGYRKVKK